jgi:hypothetical protein
MNITPEALQQLIDNDPVATELFNARLFADCAVRCRELASIKLRLGEAEPEL